MLNKIETYVIFSTFLINFSKFKICDWYVHMKIHIVYKTDPILFLLESSKIYIYKDWIGGQTTFKKVVTD